MEDPEHEWQPLLPDNGGDDDDAREKNPRLEEEQRLLEMERLLQAQEEEEHAHQHPQQPMDQDLLHPVAAADAATRRASPLTYIQVSFAVTFAMLYYAFRSRQQWYLTLVYLSSSKWAYVVLGNALLASLLGCFRYVTAAFLDGMRLQEAEGLADFFRWNITETCLALTMFRAELQVQTGILFCLLILSKCLHWVASVREQQWRMTEEAVILPPNSKWPALRWPHLKLLALLLTLQMLDIFAVLQCAQDILRRGPSVSIFFAFETTISLVTVVSSILLWHLHVVDGLFQCWHEARQQQQEQEEQEQNTQPEETGATPHHPHFYRWYHVWKDHKATLVFAVEVQAQAAKFFFYVVFFAIVMTYYGMPINLFREVYMSFQQLKQRLQAFGKYRQLMANMNRFEDASPEDLQEEPTCIICRDDMTPTTTKKLPGCGHLFHKSCLREWLVQQQSCPTCRGDIAAMEARARQEEAVMMRNVAARGVTTPDETNEAQVGVDQRDELVPPTQSNGTSTKMHHHEQQQQQEHHHPHETISTGSEKNETFTSPHPIRSILHRNNNDEEEDEDENDRKPAAVDEHTNGSRDKHVRLQVAPERKSGEDSVFPAFYRVAHDDGASVYNNGETVSFVMRMIPFGVVVLGYELSWRSCGEDLSQKQLMLRIPDGWIVERELERVVAVPLSSSEAQSHAPRTT